MKYPEDQIFLWAFLLMLFILMLVIAERVISGPVP